MGKTTTLAGDDGHPIPASQTRLQAQTKTPSQQACTALGCMLKYSNIPSKTQTEDMRSSAPSASPYRPAAIPPLRSGRDMACSTEQLRAWVPGTGQPWGHCTDLQPHAQQKALVPSRQPPYFISSKENRENTLEFFFSIFC